MSGTRWTTNLAEIPQSDSKMLDMVDMFFIILLMLLCKLHVFMFIKEQPICNVF